MTSERIKEIQETTAYPESVSVMLALNQVWNECKQEQKKDITDEEIFIEADKYAKEASKMQDIGLNENISMDFARGAAWYRDYFRDKTNVTGK